MSGDLEGNSGVLPLFKVLILTFIVALVVENVLPSALPRLIVLIFFVLDINMGFAFIIEAMEAGDYRKISEAKRSGSRLDKFFMTRRVAERMIIVALIEATPLFFMFIFQPHYCILFINLIKHLLAST
ncbi:MAG: hypothetical protein ACP5NY_04230 [Thermocladium sp.]